MQLSAMFREVDIDGNGDVDFEEFFAWFSKNGFEVDVGTLSAAKVNLTPPAEVVSPAVVAEVEPQMPIGQGADLSEGAGVGSDDAIMDVLSPKPAQELEPEQQPLDDLERQTARAVFDELDEDGSGMLDQGEFQNLCKRIGLSLNKGQAQVLFREVDKDGSGELDFDEFFQWYTDNGFKVLTTQRK